MLQEHLRVNPPCDIRETQHEGIPDDKWKLIESKWGAGWETIYQILFPGAPVPNPCKLCALMSFLVDQLTPHKDFEPEEITVVHVSKSYIPKDPRPSGDSSSQDVIQRFEREISDRLNRALLPFERGLQGLLARITQDTGIEDASPLNQHSRPRSQTSSNPTGANRSPHLLHHRTIAGSDQMLGPSANEAYEAEPPNLGLNTSRQSPRLCPQTPSFGSISAYEDLSDSGYATSERDCRCVCHIASLDANPPLREEVPTVANQNDAKGCAICFLQHVQKQTADETYQGLSLATFDEYFGVPVGGVDHEISTQSNQGLNFGVL